MYKYNNNNEWINGNAVEQEESQGSKKVYGAITRIASLITTIIIIHIDNWATSQALYISPAAHTHCINHISTIIII